MVFWCSCSLLCFSWCKESLCSKVVVPSHQWMQQQGSSRPHCMAAHTRAFVCKSVHRCMQVGILYKHISNAIVLKVCAKIIIQYSVTAGFLQAEPQLFSVSHSCWNEITGRLTYDCFWHCSTEKQVCPQNEECILRIFLVIFNGNVPE